MHHWYLPNSYDSLIPAIEAPELVEPDKRPSGDSSSHLTTGMNVDLICAQCLVVITLPLAHADAWSDFPWLSLLLVSSEALINEPSSTLTPWH